MLSILMEGSRFSKWFEPKTLFAGYSYSGSILRMSYGVFLFATSVALGTLWFSAVEGFSLVEAFYMTVITISTVGFSEVQPLDTSGKVFTAVFILLNIGIFAYSLSAFTNYVIHGEIFKNMHLQLIEKKIAELEGHIILCGFGRYGREISHHFLNHKLPFVIIEQDHEVVESIQSNSLKMLYIEGDATHDETLLKANIHKAIALIAALPDDSDNVFTILTARQLNRKINLISRAYNQRSIKKLRLAGANHVIMPEQIGGFYMATLVTKPNAVEFFSFITNENVSDIGFEEVTYGQLPPHCHGKSIRELHIRRETGTNIIGFQTAAGKYIVNPSPDTVLEKGSSFIVIGNAEQLEMFREHFKKDTTRESSSS